MQAVGPSFGRKLDAAEAGSRDASIAVAVHVIVVPNPENFIDVDTMWL
jgi:hypothetical protein